MQDWLEPLAGAIVLAITLLDVFLTVLYARAGTGLLAPRLARGVWRVFRALSGRTHPGILTYCGPVQLVALVLMWGVLLALGSGLVIHPALADHGCRAQRGPRHPLHRAEDERGWGAPLWSGCRLARMWSNFLQCTAILAWW